MNAQELTETQEPLKEVARQIREHAEKSDEHVIEAAKLLREARQRIEAGEAGEISWSSWAWTNVKLSKTRLYELLHIAESENPEAEIRRLRKLGCERIRRHRKKKEEAMRAEAARSEATHDSEEERRILMAWVRKASIEKVKTVLNLIEQEFGVSVPKPVKEPLPQNQQDAA